MSYDSSNQDGVVVVILKAIGNILKWFIFGIFFILGEIIKELWRYIREEL